MSIGLPIPFVKVSRRVKSIHTMNTIISIARSIAFVKVSRRLEAYRARVR